VVVVSIPISAISLVSYNSLLSKYDLVSPIFLKKFKVIFVACLYLKLLTDHRRSIVTQTYVEVQPEDFMKVGGDKPPHLLIEKALISLGAKTGNGGAFKKEALKLAGWNGGALTTYASRAQLAADAFNRIREALDGVSSPEDLKEKLVTLH
jgi:hypothetical protein